MTLPDSMAWEYDTTTKRHTLAALDQSFIFFYRSVGGDYVISAMNEGDLCGGHVEFCDTIGQAKKLGEQWIASGEWRNYLI
jgi:hypothetical protein